MKRSKKQKKLRRSKVPRYKPTPEEYIVGNCVAMCVDESLERVEVWQRHAHLFLQELKKQKARLVIDGRRKS